MEKVPITRNGYLRLLKELTRLRRDIRPETLEDLREARAYGVKAENQQYLSARERHRMLEKRIRDLEEKIANCEIVVGRKFFFKQAGFGTIILIRNLDSGAIHKYQLVGPFESDVTDGKLSVESPVGQGLLGHREGDEVVVYTPSGMKIYRILSIQI